MSTSPTSTVPPEREDALATNGWSPARSAPSRRLQSPTPPRRAPRGPVPMVPVSCLDRHWFLMPADQLTDPTRP
jgi:hypothetical protein